MDESDLRLVLHDSVKVLANPAFRGIVTNAKLPVRIGLIQDRLHGFFEPLPRRRMHGEQNAKNRPIGKLVHAATIPFGRWRGSNFLVHPKRIRGVFPGGAQLQIESVKRRMEQRVPSLGLPGKQPGTEPSQQTEDEALFDSGHVHIHDALVMFQLLPPLDSLNSLFFQPEDQVFQMIEDSRQSLARRSGVRALELGAQLVRLLPENSIWTAQIAV